MSGSRSRSPRRRGRSRSPRRDRRGGVTELTNKISQFMDLIMGQQSLLMSLATARAADEPVGPVANQPMVLPQPLPIPVAQQDAWDVDAISRDASEGEPLHGEDSVEAELTSHHSESEMEMGVDDSLWSLVERATRHLGIQWPAAEQPMRSLFESPLAQGLQSRMVPAFPDFIKEVQSTWETPASALATSRKAAAFTMQGASEAGLASFPPVGAAFTALLKSPTLSGSNTHRNISGVEHRCSTSHVQGVLRPSRQVRQCADKSHLGDRSAQGGALEEVADHALVALARPLATTQHVAMEPNEQNRLHPASNERAEEVTQSPIGQGVTSGIGSTDKEEEPGDLNPAFKETTPSSALSSGLQESPDTTWAESTSPGVLKRDMEDTERRYTEISGEIGDPLKTSGREESFSYSIINQSCAISDKENDPGDKKEQSRSSVNSEKDPTEKELSLCSLDGQGSNMSLRVYQTDESISGVQKQHAMPNSTETDLSLQISPGIKDSISSTADENKECSFLRTLAENETLSVNERPHLISHGNPLAEPKSSRVIEEESRMHLDPKTGEPCLKQINNTEIPEIGRTDEQNEARRNQSDSLLTVEGSDETATERRGKSLSEDDSGRLKDVSLQNYHERESTLTSSLESGGGGKPCSSEDQVSDTDPDGARHSKPDSDLETILAVEEDGLSDKHTTEPNCHKEELQCSLEDEEDFRSFDFPSVDVSAGEVSTQSQTGEEVLFSIATSPESKDTVSTRSPHKKQGRRSVDQERREKQSTETMCDELDSECKDQEPASDRSIETANLRTDSKEESGRLMYSKDDAESTGSMYALQQEVNGQEFDSACGPLSAPCSGHCEHNSFQSKSSLPCSNEDELLIKAKPGQSVSSRRTRDTYRDTKNADVGTSDICATGQLEKDDRGFSEEKLSIKQDGLVSKIKGHEFVRTSEDPYTEVCQSEMSATKSVASEDRSSEGEDNTESLNRCDSKDTLLRKRECFSASNTKSKEKGRKRSSLIEDSFFFGEDGCLIRQQFGQTPEGHSPSNSSVFTDEDLSFTDGQLRHFFAEQRNLLSQEEGHTKRELDMDKSSDEVALKKDSGIYSYSRDYDHNTPRDISEHLNFSFPFKDQKRSREETPLGKSRSLPERDLIAPFSSQSLNSAKETEMRKEESKIDEKDVQNDSRLSSSTKDAHSGPQAAELMTGMAEANTGIEVKIRRPKVQVYYVIGQRMPNSQPQEETQKVTAASSVDKEELQDRQKSLDVSEYETAKTNVYCGIGQQKLVSETETEKATPTEDKEDMDKRLEEIHSENASQSSNTNPEHSGGQKDACPLASQSELQRQNAIEENIIPEWHSTTDPRNYGTVTDIGMEDLTEIPTEISELNTSKPEAVFDLEPEVTQQGKHHGGATEGLWEAGGPSKLQRGSIASPSQEDSSELRCANGGIGQTIQGNGNNGFPSQNDGSDSANKGHSDGDKQGEGAPQTPHSPTTAQQGSGSPRTFLSKAISWAGKTSTSSPTNEGSKLGLRHEEAESFKELGTKARAKRRGIRRVDKSRSSIPDSQLYQEYSAVALDREILRHARSDTLTEDSSPPVFRKQSQTLPLTPSTTQRFSLSLNSTHLLWQELPGVRDSRVLQQLSDKSRKLQEVKFELVTSEASYLRSLDIAVDHFQKSHQLGALLSLQEKTWLFSRLAEVREVSRSFLADLEERVESEILLFDVCDIVLKHCTSFQRVYVPYLTNQSYQEKIFQRLMETNHQFQQIVEKLEKNTVCQRLPLRSFLVLPFQRITRLKLLVQLIQESNNSIRQMKSIEELVSLSGKVEFECRIFPLVSQSRRLVKEGELSQLLELPGKISERQIYLHLFNDYLLLSHPKEGSRFTVFDHTSVSRVRVENCQIKLYSLQKNLFRLHLLENSEGATTSFMLRSQTQSEKLRWLSALSPTPKIDFSACQDLPQMLCLRSYVPHQPDELNLEKADVTVVHQQTSDGWVEGTRLADSERGWFPHSHVELISSQRARLRNLCERQRIACATCKQPQSTA
ncbi:UNVERIFIED_CONTAM: hypothetical protein FKN15_059851 [Acipenser sinensis]